jgi:hypothetical protein
VLAKTFLFAVRASEELSRVSLVFLRFLGSIFYLPLFSQNCWL